MFITYKNVQSYVQQAAPESIVGICGLSEHCLIAKAVAAKYPEVDTVVVMLNDRLEAALVATTTRNNPEDVTTGDDATKLYTLATAFDNLGCLYHAVTREQALELFK